MISPNPSLKGLYKKLLFHCSFYLPVKGNERRLSEYGLWLHTTALVPAVLLPSTPGCLHPSVCRGGLWVAESLMVDFWFFASWVVCLWLTEWYCGNRLLERWSQCLYCFAVPSCFVVLRLEAFTA